MLRAALRHRDRGRLLDVAAAAVLAVAALVQVLALLPIGPRWVGAFVALASTVPIAYRRRFPAAAALVGSVVWLVPTKGFLLVGYVAVVLLYYAVTAYARDWYVAAATVLVGCLLGIAATWQRHLEIGEYAGAVLVVLAPAAVGVVVRHQRERNRRLEELAAHLDREREHRERAAVSEERGRIARELHDIVSHALSIVAVQADAAEAALERKPELAQRPLATIRSSSHEALVEMRRLLGVLRSEPERAALEPLPGLANLDALLAAAGAAGVRPAMRVEGEPVKLPQSLDLAGYRIVQEALTNAAKHAPGAAVTVLVRWRADRLELAVTDDGPGPAGDVSPDAHGIVGMHERARLHGGTVTTGAGPDGGFRVHAVLPIGSP